MLTNIAIEIIDLNGMSLRISHHWNISREHLLHVQLENIQSDVWHSYGLANIGRDSQQFGYGGLKSINIKKN